MAIRTPPARVREQAARALLREVERASATGPARRLYSQVRDEATDLSAAQWERYAREYADQVATNVAAHVESAARRASRVGLDEYLGATRPPDRATRWLQARLVESVQVPPLSRAVWTTAYGQIRQEVAESVRRVVAAQQTVFDAAAALRESGFSPTGIRPTQLTDDLLRAARRVVAATGDPDAVSAWQTTRADLEAYIRTLKTAQYRGTHFETLKRIDAAVLRGNAEAAVRAVRWNVWHRQQAHAQRTLRTEQVRAWNEAYVRETRDLPGVVGYEWETDDEPCEECQERSGAVYATDEVEYPPLHPHCRCRLVERIDTDVLPTDEEWERMIETDARAA